MKSLKLYDPQELSLPDYVQEEFIELPQVQTGFGLIDVPATKGQLAKVASNLSLSGPQGKPVNKAPGKARQAYEGGINSAVASRSFGTPGHIEPEPVSEPVGRRKSATRTKEKIPVEPVS